MKLTVGLTVLCIAASSTPCAAQVQGDGKAWSQGDVLAMRLEVLTPPTVKWDQTRLRLTVTNSSKKPIVLDKELVVGFVFGLLVDLRPDQISSDQQLVRHPAVKKLDRPIPDEVARRFVAVEPGSSLTRIYDLSNPVKFECQGHWTLRDRRHVGWYYESEVRHEFPVVKKLFAEVRYEGQVWMMSTDEYEKWFGKKQEQTGQWRGRALSNRITLELK